MPDPTSPPMVQDALKSMGAGVQAASQSIPIPEGYHVRTPSDAPTHFSYEQEILRATTTEPQYFADQDVNIGAEPPQGVVIVHVYTHGSEQYCMKGYDPEIGALDTRPKNHPNLSLGEMVQGHQHPNLELPGTICELMSEFSHSNIEIKRWLKKLRLRFNEKLHLVIVDHTDFEIPWEMFELTHREYLGALITTARWQQVIGDDGDSICLNLQPDECHGNVIAYVNRELEEVTPELSILQKLNTVGYEDIIQFRDHLQEKVPGFGLIYMACHGIYGSDIRSIALGSYKDKQQRLRLLDLRHRSFQLLKQSQGIVFLNACHSGRPQIDKKYTRDEYRRGFVELFLSKGARGVIGTIGGVGDRYATQIAHTLLDNCCHSSLSIVDLLRQLRADAVARLSSNPTDEELSSFIYTFMYVYYGNPMTVLRLAKREGPVDV